MKTIDLNPGFRVVSVSVQEPTWTEMERINEERIRRGVQPLDRVLWLVLKGPEPQWWLPSEAGLLAPRFTLTALQVSEIDERGNIGLEPGGFPRYHTLEVTAEYQDDDYSLPPVPVELPGKGAFIGLLRWAGGEDEAAPPWLDREAQLWIDVGGQPYPLERNRQTEQWLTLELDALIRALPDREREEKLPLVPLQGHLVDEETGEIVDVRAPAPALV